MKVEKCRKSFCIRVSLQAIIDTMHASPDLPDLPRGEISVSETLHDVVAEEVRTRNNSH